jgi:hypothetical protein
MTPANRGAVLQFGGSPWGREAFLADPERAARLGHRALDLGVRVGVLAKAPGGPLVVTVRRGPRILLFRGRDVFGLIEFGLERWAAGADDTGIRWAAGPDGLAHGHRKTDPRALCAASPIDERYRHPERGRCQACWRALDRVSVAA